MAGSTSQFYVEDDSPEIVYYPFVDPSLSPNASAGWEQFYSVSGAATSPGQVGVGDSVHSTSLNEASFMIKWNGTGIDLLGNAFNASYQITLDGIDISPNTSNPESILASFHDLTNTNHTVLLTTLTNQSDSHVAFDKALITYTAPLGIINSTANSTTIDDDKDIAFVGRWSYITDSTGNSMHVSNTAGDHAQTTFIGSALTVYGLVSSYSGNYSVTIDNITTSFSALSSYNNSNALLLFATELSQDTSHTVVLTNTQNTTFAIGVGGMNVTTFGNATTTTVLSSSSTSTPPGTIAAIILGVVLVVLIACIIMYWLFVVRPRTRRRRRSSQCRTRKTVDPERVIDISPPPGEEETEVESLSTSKGYGFGLGLQRTFPFVRKTKNGGSSSGHVDNTRSRSVSHVAIPPEERDDDKRFSTNTLTVEFTALGFPPESEKLAPGWTNPIARTSFGSMGKGHTRVGSHRLALPELCVEEVGAEDVYDDDDDADAKTLTSRQDETLAATLSLSPRTSEAPGLFVSAARSIAVIEGAVTENDGRESTVPSWPSSRFLEVRETSPFRVDVGAILGQLTGRQDSRRTSGSGSSSWSRVCARLYRKAHKDDGKQSIHEDKHENPSPESVPVVMLQSGSGSEPPPSEDAPASGTYSFLDFTSSHSSLRRQSKTTTLSSAAAELGHSEARTPWSDNTSMRMVRIERDQPGGAIRPGPDAPSTVSQGSQNESPSDKSNSHSSPSAQATHTTHGSSFPFPITIPPSSHMPHPFNIDYQRDNEHEEIQSFPPPPPPSPPAHRQLQVPEPRHSGLPSDANSPTSPTESVPFSVSDVYFRHSYSDYTDIDSRRESAASTLPPHPPLPSSEPNTPPPYIVQRVLGMTPVTSHSPAARLAAGPASHSSSILAERVFRPGTSPLGSSSRAPYRMGSLIGPRPRPSTSGSSTLRLPLQGSWSREKRSNFNDRLPPP